MKKDILIFSAGPSGREVLKLIQEINLNSKVKWSILGFVDKNKKFKGKKIEGINIYKSPTKFSKKNVYAICGVTKPSLRKKIYNKEIIKNGFKIPNLFHPNVIIPPSLKMGKGNIVFNNVHLSFDLKFKNYILISNFNDIGHSAKISNYVTFMPQTSLGGNCKVEEESFIGSGCNIIQNIKIGRNCEIGIGSLVIRNVKSGTSIKNYPRQTITNKL